jgi:hypothetical protein
MMFELCSSNIFQLKSYLCPNNRNVHMTMERNWRQPVNKESVIIHQDETLKPDQTPLLSH